MYLGAELWIKIAGTVSVVVSGMAFIRAARRIESVKTVDRLETIAGGKELKE